MASHARTDKLEKLFRQQVLEVRPEESFFSERFQYNGVLGKGSFGLVVSALWKAGGNRLVALKLFDKSEFREDAIKIFMWEGKVTQKYTHQHILACLAVGRSSAGAAQPEPPVPGLPADGRRHARSLHAQALRRTAELPGSRSRDSRRQTARSDPVPPGQQHHPPRHKTWYRRQLTPQITSSSRSQTTWSRCGWQTSASQCGPGLTGTRRSR